jgi:hypothetical protein
MAARGNMESAKQLANAPSKLRGYGHLRAQSRKNWLEQRNRNRAELQFVQSIQENDVNHRGINEH